MNHLEIHCLSVTQYNQYENHALSHCAHTPVVAIKAPTLTLRQSTRLVRVIDIGRLFCRHLTGGDAIARRHVQRWILKEEIPWSKQQSHGLGRHNRIVFWSWEVGNAECMPEHDIRVLDALVAVLLDPFRETLGRLARRLWHMSSGWMKLIILVCTSSATFKLITRRLTLGNMYGVSCETSSLPDQTVILGQQHRNLSTDKLVA